MEVDAFYSTKKWRKCRQTYIAKVGGLCEMCLKQGIVRPGSELHHKIHLTQENITDPRITLNHDNLIYLCIDHHHEMHTGKRWRTDEQGRVSLDL